MALRASSPPAPSTRSATVGARIVFAAKVENSGAADGSVSLFAEDLKEGALARPLAFVLAFDPPAASVRARSRSVVEFAWTAALPAGKDAFTFRGRLVLRETTTGRLVGEAPLDLYVSAPRALDGPSG